MARAEGLCWRNVDKEWHANDVKYETLRDADKEEKRGGEGVCIAFFWEKYVSLSLKIDHT